MWKKNLQYVYCHCFTESKSVWKNLNSWLYFHFLLSSADDWTCQMLCKEDNFVIFKMLSPTLMPNHKAKALHLFNGLIEIQAALPKIAQKMLSFIRLYQGTINKYMSWFFLSWYILHSFSGSICFLQTVVWKYPCFERMWKQGFILPSFKLGPWKNESVLINQSIWAGTMVHFRKVTWPG